VISAHVVIIVIHLCYIGRFGLNSFSLGVCSFLFLFVDVLIAAVYCIGRLGIKVSHPKKVFDST